MSKKWYYRVKKKTQGPVTNAELLDLIRERKVLPETMIRKDDSQWVAARAVTGLFQAAGVFAGEYRCPYCGNSIDDPPTTCEKCHRNVSEEKFGDKKA